MYIEEENVKVVVRIRPMQTEEKKSGDVPCVKAGNDGREVQVKVGPLDAQVYRCNNCFNPETNQVDFFHESGITDLLDSAIQGYRACAFAFGQTGAGKTHTMIGSAKGISSRDKNVGLVPRSLDYLYEKLNQLNLKYKIKLSCLEIYHEHVYDLFAEDKERTPMAVREHNVEGFFLEGARLVDCSNYNIACNVLDVAFKNRQVGFHDLNSRSSRSHCMTEIYIETFPDPDGSPDQVVRGKMSLVDLAGSERLKSTNSTGKVLQEAGFINRSLYVLGKVIAGLVRTNGDLNHKDVPYRDSKLTKLLISSLGGSSRTLMISCVSEAKGSQAETLRTLKFSMSCARIRNKPIKFLDPQEKLIVDLKDEIKRLRQENQRLRSTLVTAPTSTDSMHSLIGGEDMSPSRMRASSANSSVSPTRRRISPEKMRKAAGGPGMSKKRTNAVAGVGGQGGRKTKNTKSTKKKPDIFYKYPQLERILGDDDSIESFTGSPKRGRLRPSKGAREDNNKGRVSDGGGESHMSASEAIMMGDTEGHDDGNHSVHSLNSHGGGGPRRMRPEVLDEMVHRRAPGPMILKDVQHAPYEPLRDSRLNKYYPAENHIKSMDQKKIDVLEQRIAKMEAQQQRLERLQAAGKAGAADGGAAAAAAAAARDDDGADDYASYEDEFADGEQPHGHGPHHPPVQGIPPSNAYDDDATIQNSIAIDGSELVKAGKHKGGAAGGPKKTQKKKKEKGVSPYIAHLGANKIQKFQQALDEKPRKAVESVPPPSSKIAAGKPKAAPTAPPKPKAAALSSAPVAQERKEAHSVAMVRQSIDQELEELGLSEILGKPSSYMPSQADFANVISAATKKPTGAVAQSKSTPQIDHAAKKHPPTNNSNGNGNGNGNGNNSSTKQTTGGPNKSQSLPQIQSKQQQVDGGALVHAANTRKRGSRDAGDTTTEKLPPIKAAASTSTTNVSAAGAKKTAATDDNVQKPTPVAATARASSASSPAGKKPAAVQNSPATAAKAGPAAAGSAKKAPSSSPTKKSIDMSHEANYEEDDEDFMPPTPDRLKEKLHALEASLVSKRIEMEDNPGDVTNEIEEKFKNLQLETLVIKQQLSELAGEAFPAVDSDKQAMGPGKSPVRPPPGPTASSAGAAEEEEEEENYEDDYYGEDDFENDDAGAGGSPKRPRTRGSPAKHVEDTNDAMVDDAVVDGQNESVVAAVATVSVAAVVASPAAVSPVSPVAPKSPFATTTSEKTEEEVSSKVVTSPVAAAPVTVGSTKSPSPPPPAAATAVEARSAPDTATNGDEEDNYEDEYDVDFEADDDKAPSRAASPGKSKKSSPTRTSSSSVPVGTTEDPQQSTPTSVVQTDKAMMSSPLTKAANDATTAPAKVEATAPVAPPSSSPPPRRAKTPAKTPADDDYDAYAEDGFDDFDVSFNEDN